MPTNKLKLLLFVVSGIKEKSHVSLWMFSHIAQPSNVNFCRVFDLKIV